MADKKRRPLKMVMNTDKLPQSKKVVVPKRILSEPTDPESLLRIRTKWHMDVIREALPDETEGLYALVYRHVLTDATDGIAGMWGVTDEVPLPDTSMVTDADHTRFDEIYRVDENWKLVYTIKKKVHSAEFKYSEKYGHRKKIRKEIAEETKNWTDEDWEKDLMSTFDLGAFLRSGGFPKSCDSQELLEHMCHYDTYKVYHGNSAMSFRI